MVLFFLDHVKVTAELENRYEYKLADQLDRYDRWIHSNCFVVHELSDTMTIRLAELLEKEKQRCQGLVEAERKRFETDKRVLGMMTCLSTVTQ
jgi:hypothetical protein